MRIVRMVRSSDLESLVALASKSSGLMTTMPRDRAGMEERLNEALQFDETFMFVLVEDEKIVGMSAFYLNIGQARPFYSYKITHLTKAAPDLGVRVDTRVLHPVNDYSGATEVGTLFLDPDYRGDGRGRLLSWSRLMFLATHRQLSGDIVMAELRGWTDNAGRSPFWDAIGNRFFTLDLDEADILSGREFRFIADLLPNYPIYIDLLPDEAQRVIGVPHDGSAPAMNLLGQQGLRFNGYVDIFDGGPCIDGHLDDVDLVRSSTEMTVSTMSEESSTTSGFVATLGISDFSVGQFEVALGDHDLGLDYETRDALGTTEGETVRFYRWGR